MVIQHNMAAMFGDRQYKITNNIKKKSSEKLASGYKINRAADDAAGLAISEKMRRQIRGLTQASLNAQDGNSLVQTAEGALVEAHEMLQRLNELCVKAANGTMTYADRDYIQDEIYQINSEMDRIGASTYFNEIKILDGLQQTQARAVVPSATVNGNIGTITPASSSDDAYYTIPTIKNGDIVYIPGQSGGSESTYYKVASKDEIYAYEDSWHTYYSDKSAYDTAKRQYDAEWAAYYDAKSKYDQDPTAEGAEEPTPPTTVEPTPPTEPLRRDGSSSSTAQLMEVEEVNVKFAQSLSDSNLDANSGIAENVGVNYATAGDRTDYSIHFYGPLTINLQVGSNAEDTYSFRINPFSSATIGVFDINVKDMNGKGALEGIEKVKQGIEINSRERSNLGAVQNRIGHMIKNLDNMVENATAAESKLRDTEMAHEITHNTNTDLLAQAGQMILAQANQSKQGVLNLLQ